MRCPADILEHFAASKHSPAFACSACLLHCPPLSTSLSPIAFPIFFSAPGFPARCVRRGGKKERDRQMGREGGRERARAREKTVLSQ